MAVELGGKLVVALIPVVLTVMFILLKLGYFKTAPTPVSREKQPAYPSLPKPGSERL